MAVVDHLDLQLVGLVADDHARMCTGGLVQRRHQRLVDHAIGDRIKIGGKRQRPPFDAHVHGQAGRDDLLGEIVEVGQARLRLGQRRSIGRKQQAGEALRLFERVGTRSLDHDKGAMRCGGVVVERAARVARLQDHRAHGPLDDVAQLAHDLVATGRVGRGRARLPVELADHALVASGGTDAAYGQADEPGTDEGDRRHRVHISVERPFEAAQDDQPHECAHAERPDLAGAASGPGADRIGRQHQPREQAVQGLILRPAAECQRRTAEDKRHERHPRAQREREQEDDTGRDRHDLVDGEVCDQRLPRDRDRQRGMPR